MTQTAISTDKLLSDLKVVAADAEELIRLTADQAGDKLVEVRDRLSTRLEQVKSSLVDLQGDALEHGKRVADATDQYVHDNPWKAIGAAGGIAFLLGLLIGRR